MEANDGGFRSDYREGIISGHKLNVGQVRSGHLYCKDKGDDKAILSVSAELARERRAPCGFSNLTGRIAITGCRSCVISNDLLSNLECAHKTQQLITHSPQAHKWHQ